MISVCWACISSGDWELRTVGGRKQAPDAEAGLLAAAVEHTLGMRGDEDPGHGLEPGDELLIRRGTLPVTKKKSFTFPQEAADARRYLPKLDAAVWASFKKHNKEPVVWGGAALESAAKTRIVDDDKLRKMMDEGRWTAFRKAFPKVRRLIGASRPGYDEAHRNAVLFMSWTTTGGEPNGWGMLYQLRRDGDAWKVVKAGAIWAS